MPNTLNFSIHIDAPKEKVWDTMLDDATYREWTSVFNPGSRFQGDWAKGSKISFIGTDENGQELGGMLAEIAENRLHEFISIRHLGEIQNGEEKPWGEDESGQAYENYTFTEKDGGTDLSIELIGIPDEYMGMFDDMWPKALEKLKQITQQQV